MVHTKDTSVTIGAVMGPRCLECQTTLLGRITPYTIAAFVLWAYRNSVWRTVLVLALDRSQQEFHLDPLCKPYSN
jgi:hypothetical protein